jgi:hypothetical protein
VVLPDRGQAGALIEVVLHVVEGEHERVGAGDCLKGAGASCRTTWTIESSTVANSLTPPWGGGAVSSNAVRTACWRVSIGSPGASAVS